MREFTGILFPSLESDGGEFSTLVSQVSRLAELVWRGEWGAGPRVTALVAGRLVEGGPLKQCCCYGWENNPPGLHSRAQCMEIRQYVYCLFGKLAHTVQFCSWR